MSKNPTYEQLQEELEVILGSLQDEKTSVEDITQKFERGLELIEQLQKKLDSVEQKITTVQKAFKRET